jgi:hypothetical protein
MAQQIHKILQSFPDTEEVDCQNCGIVPGQWISAKSGRRLVCSIARKDQRKGELSRRRERKYGLTRQDVIDLLVYYNFSCAICKEYVDETTLHIDHCHKTNAIRGILCGTCNVGLGMFKDDTVRLVNAIQYLTVLPTHNVAPKEDLKSQRRPGRRAIDESERSPYSSLNPNRIRR